ncbi:MAG: aminotransferase class I/II-fold pyridoxal phosphate-dependent enzyme, partial [Candidatus Hodarchaeota archaeon]
LRWGNVDNCFRISLGAIIHSFDLFDENYQFTFNQLKSKITEMTSSASRLIIYLNFPNNPGGHMPSIREIEKLQNILKDVSIPTIILLDDAYEGYVYEDSGSNQKNPIPHSIFPYLLSLNENIVPVKIDGPSKRFCAYGTRLGMISLGFQSENDVITDSELRKQGLNISEAFTKAARGHCSSAPRGIQEALSKILSDKDKYKSVLEEKKALKSLLEQRYRCLQREVHKQGSSSILKPLAINSGFFGFYFIKGISAKVLAEQLLENGLGVVPFENKKIGINGIRIAFCSILEKDIPEAVEIFWRVSHDMIN